MSETLPEPSPRHLIFIHGAGVGPWMWRRQTEHFGGRFRVHTPTLPGHELHSRDAYTTHADAARSIADQVGLPELEGEVTVIGFSLGGQVAIELASTFPGIVDRTVIVSSLVRPWRAAALWVRLARLAMPLAQNERFARAQATALHLPDEDFDAYFALSSSISKQTFGAVLSGNFTFAPPAAFLRSTRPVLLIAGSTEQRTLIRNLERLGDSLPVAEFTLIDGVGHGAPLATAQIFNDRVEAWLAE